MQKFTSTSLACFRSCPRKYFYRYEMCLAREQVATPLRIGTAWHKLMEVLIAQQDVLDGLEDLYEVATLVALYDGYRRRYAMDTMVFLATERPFELKIPCGANSKRSISKAKRAGKIDAIVELNDGRVAVLEYKTCGEDIGPDSDYWLRLRGDHQVSEYITAARDIGYPVEFVIYDVVRKPTILPYKATPPESRKYTKEGRLYANQRDTDETPEDYRRRLASDIAERPDYYYARREVWRSRDELRMFEDERAMQIKTIKDVAKRGAWYRNVSRWNCSNCEFSGPCLGGVKLDRDNVPSGFVVLPDPHPELEANSD